MLELLGERNERIEQLELDVKVRYRRTAAVPQAAACTARQGGSMPLHLAAHPYLVVAITCAAWPR